MGLHGRKLRGADAGRGACLGPFGDHRDDARDQLVGGDKIALGEAACTHVALQGDVS